MARVLKGSHSFNDTKTKNYETETMTETSMILSISSESKTNQCASLSNKYCLLHSVFEIINDV